MELIYANHDREDIGVLINPELDLAFGEDENDFECTVDIENHCCEEGFYIYAEGTEYGGIVDAIEIDSGEDIVSYTGRTWHGMLASKVLPLGFTVEGDAADCIKTILDTINLAPLFVASEEPRGVQIEAYTLDDYTDAYTVLRDVLKTVGLRLNVEYFDGVVTLSAVPVFDFSDGKEMESDLIEYQMTKTYRKPNHLVCIANSGAAVHLYIDAEGNVSETQTFFGVEEYTAIGGKPSDKEEERTLELTDDERESLIESGTKTLEDMQTEDKIDVSFDSDEDAYYIGDIVGAYDSATGISVAEPVTKKILNLARGKAEIEYKVGEKNG